MRTGAVTKEKSSASRPVHAASAAAADVVLDWFTVAAAAGPPPGMAFAPVIGKDRVVAIGPRTHLLTLDHDPLAGLVPTNRNSTGRATGSVSSRWRVVEARAGLEDVAEQMFRRQAPAAAKARERVQRIIEPQQLRGPPAAAASAPG